jgi:hypothetical protein
MGSVVEFNQEPKFNIKVKGIKEKLKSSKNGREAADNLESVASYFHKSLRAHRKRLKKSKQTLADSAGNIAVLSSLLDMMVSLMPTAERVYRKYKNERAAYAIVALIKELREVSSDIQRYSSSQKNAEVLVDKIIFPSFQLILQNYINSSSHIAKIAASGVKPKLIKKEIDKSVAEHTAFLKEIVQATIDKTSQYFTEK